MAESKSLLSPVFRNKITNNKLTRYIEKSAKWLIGPIRTPNKRLRWGLFGLAFFLILSSIFLGMSRPEEDTRENAQKSGSYELFKWEALNLAPNISLGIATSVLAVFLMEYLSLSKENRHERKALADLLGIQTNDKIALVMTHFKRRPDASILTVFHERGACVTQKVHGGKDPSIEFPDPVMLSENDFNGMFELLKLFKELNFECDVLFDDAVLCCVDSNQKSKDGPREVSLGESLEKLESELHAKAVRKKETVEQPPEQRRDETSEVSDSSVNSKQISVDKLHELSLDERVAELEKKLSEKAKSNKENVEQPPDNKTNKGPEEPERKQLCNAQHLRPSMVGKYGVFISVGWYSNELTGWVLNEAELIEEVNEKIDNKIAQKVGSSNDTKEPIYNNPHYTKVIQDSLKDVNNLNIAEVRKLKNNRDYVHFRGKKHNSIQRGQSILARVKVPSKGKQQGATIVIVGGEDADDTLHLCRHIYNSYDRLVDDKSNHPYKSVRESSDYYFEFLRENETHSVIDKKCLAK
ncbi:MAG: hypothetical protein AAFN40_02485 [Cyanobacteria bacterium J06560_6]